MFRSIRRLPVRLAGALALGGVLSTSAMAQTSVSATAISNGGTAVANASGSNGAQVNSTAQASLGGTAVSNANGQGNAYLNSTAAATQGGYSQSQINGVGRNGGVVVGNSSAMSVGGAAASRVDLRAYGPGAQVYGQGAAAADYGGTANTRVVGRAYGNAVTDVRGTALARPYGAAGTYVDGRAAGFSGGRSSVTLDGVSDSYGPPATARVVGRGYANTYGQTVVQGAGVAVGGYRPAAVSVDVRGRSSFGGTSQATGFGHDGFPRP